MKRCRDCGDSKPIKHFHKNVSHKDGHNNTCSDCHTKYCRKKRNVKVKTCTRCGKEKPMTKFHRMNSAQDGRQTRCMLCRANSKDAIPYGCDKCAFLTTCRHNIRLMSFDPYCFVSSKDHGLYQQEYGTEKGEEREFIPNLSRDKVAAMFEELP